MLKEDGSDQKLDLSFVGGWGVILLPGPQSFPHSNPLLFSRYYSNLRYCLEYEADKFGLGFPNPLAERIILEAHLIHFANCSLVQPTFSDPPEDVLLAMVIAPICLIPFLVTLVVWRSKDGDAQA